jgi:hypothetical protein
MSRKPRQVFLKVVIPQTKTYVQQRKPDWQGLLESVLSSHQFNISPLHYVFPSVKVLGGWALYTLTNQSGCLIACTTCPMRSDSGRDSRCLLIMAIFTTSLLLFLRLQSSSRFVKSSDCRTIGRSPGHVRRRKW